MPLFEVELEDGRILEMESENEPTEQEVLNALQAYQPQEVSAPTGPDYGALSETLRKQQEYQENLRAYTGGSLFAPGGPDRDLAMALYGPGGAVYQGAGAVGGAIHAAMQPVEKVAAPLMGYTTGVGLIRNAIGEPIEAGKSVFPGLEPAPEDAGVIPSVRRAAAGMTTPGGVALLPIAGAPGAVGKGVTGAFAVGATAAIPTGIESFIQAKTPAERRGAATDVALSAGFAGLMGRNLVKQRPSYASQVRETAQVHGDVLRRPGQGAQEVPAEVGGAGVRPEAAKKVSSISDEMAKLQTARDAGMLGDADAARLEALEAEHGVKGLSTEDAQYVIREREGLQGINIGGKQVGIEVVESMEGQPFASASADSPFTINPETGSVVIIADRMATYRPRMRRLGFSEAQIEQAIKSSINEEMLHLGTDPMIATEYWNRLTGFEKAIIGRRYGLGEAPGPEMTPQLLGMEALRFRMQQATRMTPTEFTQMVGLEKWTWQGLTALESAIRFVRENFTQLGKEQKHLFDIALANITSAKSAIGGKTPAAPMRKIVEIEREDGTRYEAEFNGYYDMRPYGGKLTPSIGRGNVRGGETLSHGLLAPTEKVVTKIPTFEEWQKAVSTPTTPSAPRRKGEEIGRRGKSPFDIDYTNLQDVKEYAESFGAGVVVFKNPEMGYYNIADASRTDLFKPDWVVHRTGESGQQSFPAAPRRTFDPNQPPKLSFKEWYAKFLAMQRTMRPEDTPSERKQKLGPEFQSLIDDYPEHYEMLSKVKGAGHSGWPKIGPSLGPSAPRRKGPMSRRGEEMAKLQAMRVAAAQGEVEAKPSAPKPEFERSGFKPITPEAAAEAVRDYILNEPILTRVQAKKISEQEGYKVKPRAKFSYEEFAGRMRSEFGSMDSSAFREVFGQSVGESLMDASGERLTEILKAMNLVKNVFGGGRLKPGERVTGIIPDPVMGLSKKLASKATEQLQELRGMGVSKITTPVVREVPVAKQLMMSIASDKGPVEVSKVLDRAIGRKGPPTQKEVASRQKLRHRAIAEILYNLFSESEQLKRAVSRTEVTAEELGSAQTAKEPVFRTIRSSELTDLDRLGGVLTSDARVFNQAVSVTKRLVAMLNKQSGAVDMLDIYLDGRRGPVVMSPGGAPSHQSLESVMRTHRPIYSILLDEPVQNFRKRFKDIKEFQNEFGSEAQERMRAMEYQDIAGEGVEPEMEAGAEPTSGTMARRNKPGMLTETEKPITDAEAMSAYSWVAEDTGGIKSVEDVRNAVDSFQVAMSLPIGKRPYQAMSAFVKMIRSQMEQNKDMTEGQALEAVAKFIYENNRAANTPEQLIQRTLANYGGEISEPVPEAIAGAQAGAVRGRETISQQRATKRAQWLAERGFPRGVEPPEFPFEGTPERPQPVTRELTAPGYSTIARQPIEGVGAGLRETMARGTQVREAAAEAEVPTGAEKIRQEALQPEADPRFDRMVKEIGEIQRQVEAEVEQVLPRKGGESLEDWLVRVREMAPQFEEWRAAQQQAERGPITPAAPRRKLKDLQNEADAREAALVDQFVIGPAKQFAEWYSGWMTQNIRRNGGVASSQAADMADRAIDRTKQIYGELTPVLDPALVLAGGTKEFPLFQQMPTPKQVATTIWLNRLDHRAGKDTGVSRTVDAIEGNVNPPKFSRETVDAARAANLQTGGLILEHPTGKFQRNMTGFGYDIYMGGDSPAFDALVKANAKLNVNPENIAENFRRFRDYDRAVAMEQARVEADMRDLWSQWRQENLKPMPDINRIEKINQDFIRLWPKVETHVKTPAGWMQVLHTDLHNYLKNSALRTSHVAAFREQFPNTPEGRKALSALDKEVRNELGPEHQGDWNSLIKTLQGRPTDSYNRFGPLAPGKPWAEFLRALDQTAISLTRRAVLTGQMVTQLPETAVAPFVFFSPKNVLTTAVRFKSLWPTMEITGQINKLMYDFSIDPANPVRTMARFAGNLVSKAFFEHFLNEFQGKWFAANATVAVDRMLAGRMSKRELADFRETIRNTGFTAEQSSRMLAGDVELLKQFTRRVPTWAVGENKLMAEGSRIGANRLFNSIFRFQLYPMTKMNQFRMAMGRVIEANRYGDAAEKIAANKLLVKMLTGTTMQGAMLSVLSAYAFGGPEAGEQKFRQAKDDPVTFMTEALLGAMSGPLYLVWSGVRYNGWLGLGEQATRIMFPFSVMSDFALMTAGEGQYKDLDTFDRVAKFLSQKAPGFRILETQLATWVLGEDSKKLKADIKAVAQWKRDTFGWTKVRTHRLIDEREEFRVQMGKAMRYLVEDGNPEKYMEAKQAAMNSLKGRTAEEKKQAVARTTQSWKMLTNADRGELTAEQKDDLRKRIGDEAYRRIEQYDKMLDRVSGAKPDSE